MHSVSACKTGRLNPDCRAIRFVSSGRRVMVVVETIGWIRHGQLVKGKSIKVIAHDLKISRNPVR